MLWISLLTSLLALAGRTWGCTYNLPWSTPSDAAGPIDPSFLGYAYECATFVRFAQEDDGTPNNFTLNMMDSLVQRTGGGPFIRAGGTVSDYARYYPDQQVPVFPEISRHGMRDINFTTVGTSYFGLPKNFESLNPKFVWGVPQVQVNISESVAWAKAIYANTPNKMIDAIEVGNEPDLFNFNKAAPVGPLYYPNVSNESYVDIANAHFSAISSALNMTNGTRFYQAFDTAMHFPESENAWYLPVPKVWGLGIDDYQQTKYVAHHWYQTQNGTPATIAADFMNHSSISSGLEVFRPWIKFLDNVTDVKIPFILSEAANSLNGGVGYQDVFATTLWQVDWELYSMVVGVYRVNLQTMYAANYYMFNPVLSDNTPPQAYAPWYAQPFVADFIGKSGGTTKMTILDAAKGTEQPNVVGYAAYEGEDIKRVALINFNYWDGRNVSASTRLNEPVTLSDLPSGTTSVMVKKLTSPLGAHAQAPNITYGGSQWLESSNGKEFSVLKDTETLSVSGGTVVVDVPASSAVLVWIKA